MLQLGFMRPPVGPLWLGQGEVVSVRVHCVMAVRMLKALQGVRCSLRQPKSGLLPLGWICPGSHSFPQSLAQVAESLTIHTSLLFRSNLW